jgi:hypothetical protein
MPLCGENQVMTEKVYRVMAQKSRYRPLIRERQRAVDTIGSSNVHVYRRGYTMEHIKMVVNTEWFVQWDVPLKVRLLFYLLSRMRIADGTRVYVATEEMVEKLNAPAKSVYSALQALKQDGLLIKRRSNVYELNPHLFWIGLYNKVNKDGELEDYAGDAQKDWDRLVEVQDEMDAALMQKQTVNGSQERAH